MKANSFIQFIGYLSFLLECVLFISVGHFGFNLFENIAISILIAAISPLVAIYYWGRYQVAKSPKCLQPPVRTIVAIVAFAVGAMFFHVTGATVFALIFFIVAFINQLILFILRKG